MPRTWRRILSWLFVLAIVAAVAIGWRYVPGAGGTADEIRWLLARDDVPTRHYNRAANLIALAEHHRPGAARDIIDTLVADDDHRVVRGTLALIFDRIRPENRELRDVYAAFDQWRQADPKEPPAVRELITSIFGPNWRELCEGGGPASQPGAGNGGG